MIQRQTKSELQRQINENYCRRVDSPPFSLGLFEEGCLKAVRRRVSRWMFCRGRQYEFAAGTPCQLAVDILNRLYQINWPLWACTLLQGISKLNHRANLFFSKVPFYRCHTRHMLFKQYSFAIWISHTKANPALSSGINEDCTIDAVQGTCFCSCIDFGFYQQVAWVKPHILLPAHQFNSRDGTGLNQLETAGNKRNN